MSQWNKAIEAAAKMCDDFAQKALAQQEQSNGIDFAASVNLNLRLHASASQHCAAKIRTLKRPTPQNSIRAEKP